MEEISNSDNGQNNEEVDLKASELLKNETNNELNGPVQSTSQNNQYIDIPVTKEENVDVVEESLRPKQDDEASNLSSAENLSIEIKEEDTPDEHSPSSPSNNNLCNTENDNNSVNSSTSSSQVSTSLPSILSLASSQNMCSSSSMLMNIANQSQENLFLQKQQPYLQTSFVQTLLALNNNAVNRPGMIPFMEGYV